MKHEPAKTELFNQLAAAYSTDLYRYAMWLCGNDALAKDLVQETYLRAWRALDRLKDTAAAKGWLITILRREFARTFERKVPKFTGLDKVMVADEEEDGGTIARQPVKAPGKLPLLSLARLTALIGITTEEDKVCLIFQSIVYNLVKGS